MDKLKFTMKLCKEIAENVEAALFKVCESNLNSPKYKGWTKTFIQNITDCRNKVSSSALMLRIDVVVNISLVGFLPSGLNG